MRTGQDTCDPGDCSTARLRYPRGVMRHGAIKMLAASGSLRAARRMAAIRGDIIVLTLHRIVPDGELGLCRSPMGMVLRESLFARLIDHLSDTADIVSPANLGQAERSVTRPRILITFDDGWLDNIEIALPYLTRAKVKACFFAVTSLVGQKRPFWPERVSGILTYERETGDVEPLRRLLGELNLSVVAPRILSIDSVDQDKLLTWMKQFTATRLSNAIELGYEAIRGRSDRSQEDRDPMEALMTWEHLRSLAAHGHGVGSHTCTHALLTQLSQGQLQHELRESLLSLRGHLPAETEAKDWISYPNGFASDEVCSAASSVGYRVGFVNRTGLWRSDTNPMLIPRVNIWDGTLTDKNGSFDVETLDYALYWRTKHAIAGS